MTTEGFATADCPMCGKFSTRPLPHLMFVHKWPKKKARKWVKANAEIYKNRRDWDKRGPFSKGAA